MSLCPKDSKTRWLFIEHLLCPGSEVVFELILNES